MFEQYKLILIGLQKRGRHKVEWEAEGAMELLGVGNNEHGQNSLHETLKEIE